MTLEDCPTPALVLDLGKLERNLDRMAARTESLGVSLRPHIKTHKCPEVAALQVDRGCKGLTVSTLYEGRVFANHGHDDITWAFPLILSRLQEAAELAHQIRLGLVVDSEEAVRALAGTGTPLQVWLKVDCGYHRAGVDPDSPQAVELARRLHESTRLEFKGLLTHSGHAYRATTRAELAGVAEQERSRMVQFAERLRGEGIPVAEISIGSTPAMSQVASLDGVTEARPGNYVFYDLSQVRLGSCSVEDCAVTVLSTVVSSHPSRGHSVIDAGALSLSTDAGVVSEIHPPTFGEVFEDYAAGLLAKDVRVSSLSQEHGMLTTSPPVGSRIRILPNHSCLTVGCFDEYLVARGDRIVDRWKIWRGR